MRNEENNWTELETNISDHSNTKFSHGICPHRYETIVTPGARNAEAEGTGAITLMKSRGPASQAQRHVRSGARLGSFVHNSSAFLNRQLLKTAITTGFAPPVRDYS